MNKYINLLLNNTCDLLKLSIHSRNTNQKYPTDCSLKSPVIIS